MYLCWRGYFAGCGRVLKTVLSAGTVMNFSQRPNKVCLLKPPCIDVDCGFARDAFNLLIPLSVESELQTAVILDFFAFLASVAAHAKSNGFAGQRLARIAGWYAFDVKGSAAGFAQGYSNWERSFANVPPANGRAANATEHLFLAYLRSIAPTAGQISAALPLSLSTLLSQTKYPPKPITAVPIAPGATSILRITLSVRTVSPTPFALLNRLARHSFVQTNPNERGDALEALIEAQSTHGDPTKALTNECLRVLRLVAATNESDVLTAALLRTPNSLEDKTWTRFADLGFEGLDPSDVSDEEDNVSLATSPDGTSPPARRRRDFLGMRPKTPSWGDFLVSGFPAGGESSGFSLPPDKLLPPINTNTLPQSSSRRSLASRDGTNPFRSNLHELEKGEVKSVERSRVDDALWSVWMESLCGEELEERKAVFGRCVVAETVAADSGRRWIVVEVRDR
jgi:Meiotically up-regulated protein Msb1/Mug8 domain